jgi:hypothetical protein
MAKQRRQNRSLGGPGSSHKTRPSPRATYGMVRSPRSAERRLGVESRAGAGNAISTTLTIRARSRGTLPL